MNAFLKLFLVSGLAAACDPQAWSEPSAPAAAKPKIAPARSIFTMPASPREGRDPFFPDSMRPYESTMTVTNRPAAEVFAVNGYSVDQGRAMLIINNHTFGVGDEGDVLSAGKRVHLRLLEIQQNKAVIEVNGSKRQLIIMKK